MNASKQKAARNAAKVEFLACVEEAVSMLEKGFNKFNVYNSLLDRGIITMAYRSFCWNLQKFNSVKTVKKKQAPPVVRPAQPGIIKAKPDALQDPRTIDPATVF